MIKLLVLDMDGTLLNSCHEISKANIQAILELQRTKKVRVALASGRNFAGLQEQIKVLQLDRYKGFIIGNNGQDFYDFEEHLFEKGEKIPQEVCRKTLQFGIRHKLEVFAHNNLISSFYSPETDVKLYPDRKSLRFIEETQSFIDEDGMDKIGLFIAEQRDDSYPLLEGLKKEIKDEVQVVLVNKTCIELVPNGMDKVNGIDKICQKYHLRKNEVLVMGDGQNDVKMAENYPFIATGNALEEVKKRAIEVTVTNDEDAVAHIIKTKILGG